MKKFPARLFWREYGPDRSNASLLVESKTHYVAAVANIFKNAKGSFTALGQTFKTMRGAKRAVYNEFVLRKTKGRRS